MRRYIKGFDAIWSRRSIGMCELLERAHALGPFDRSLVSFGIMWAPTGGSDAEEIMITFGVSRTDYLALLTGALTPRSDDPRQAKELKTILREELLRAWKFNRENPVQAFEP
ncbi:hypothetical protein [Rhodococcus triatomae]